MSQVYELIKVVAVTNLPKDIYRPCVNCLLDYGQWHQALAEWSIDKYASGDAAIVNGWLLKNGFSEKETLYFRTGN